MRLYDHPNSGNGYKVRLFLGLIARSYEAIPVDVAARQHKQPDFLKLNPRGQIPVLEDDGTILFDSQAILAYLAARHAPEWGGSTASETGYILQWLSFAAKELSVGLQAARLYYTLGVPTDIEVARADAQHSLSVLETWLAERPWLACDRHTIADIACYPYVSLASEARVDLADFPSVRAWLERIENLAGYVTMLQCEKAERQ